MLRADHLSKVFYRGRGEPTHAVQDASFEAHAGEILGLLGPNGAGKTTLLRMLGAIISPTSGKCYVGDLSTAGASGELRRRIGFMSGNTKLYGRLTGREVLRYFGRLFEMSDGDIKTRTKELVELLDMGAFIDYRCDSLSTGQLQRVSIARVLVHDPPVLILDEPTLGLDIMTSTTILDFVVKARERGRCVVFSTHYMTEAELICDRIGMIHHGRILAMGTKDELYARTGASNLKDAFLTFVGGPED